MFSIIHTADWHLGAKLVDRDRSEEHKRFLHWLGDVIEAEKIGLLIVAGDIFDAANPPNDAVETYYQFLSRLAMLRHCHAVIVAGNHDSASHLNAPRDLLSQMRVHVFGAPPADPAEAILEFPDCVVCAVPFLRERDLRQASAGDTWETAEAQVRAGIARYYAQMLVLARRRAAGKMILTTGHLTTLSGIRTPESEREIHVGNLGAVSSEIFRGFDYAALGHLHRPQGATEDGTVRYAGSPLALSFAEMDDVKEITRIDLDAATRSLKITSIPIPATRRLLRFAGDIESVRLAIESFSPIPGEITPWAEARIEVPAFHPDYEKRVHASAVGGQVEILKIVADLPQRSDLPVAESPSAENLEDLVPLEVFRRKLRAEGLDENSPEAAELIATFQELEAELAALKSA